MARGHSILERDGHGLKTNSRHWLLRALDPMHDTEVKPCGFPDLDGSASVIQELNRQITVSCPAGVTTGTWDLHVFNMAHFAQLNPLSAGIGTSGNFMATGRLDPTNNTPSAYGSLPIGGTGYYPVGLQVLSGPNGSALLPNQAGDSVAATVVNSIQVSDLITGKCRVVGGGFEVINTTAPIYQQGTVTAYRSPQTFASTMIESTVATTPVVGLGFPATMHLMAPSSPAAALLLPGSKQWPAARGSYSVFTLCDQENPFQAPDARLKFYMSGFDYGQEVPPVIAQNRGVNSNQTISNAYAMPYNCSGVYLTGLSLQTSLTITLKLIVEVAPGPLDALATLATESPEYDPAALELYSRIAKELPPAVPSDMNPAGEYFKQVCEIAGEVAGAASLIHPAFGLVSRGAKMLGGIGAPAITAIERAVARGNQSFRPTVVKKATAKARPRPKQKSKSRRKGR